MKNINKVMGTLIQSRLAINRSIYFLVLILFSNSCFTAGTHGYIKAYEYPVAKVSLQEAVEKVLKKNVNVYRLDTVASTDSNYHPENYYNDGNRYVTIKIKSNDELDEFTFQYSGTENEWSSSPNSFLSIVYAYDSKRNGGSEGNGGISWKTPSLKKKLINVFESEFIYKVDKELGIQHTDR